MATQQMAEILPFQRGMTAQRRSELTHILRLSESIHQQAQRRSWQMAAQLQKTRREAIDVFFEQAPQAYEAETIHDVLKQVLALDAEVSLWLIDSKEALMIEGRQSRQQLTAAKAYQISSN